MPSIVSFAGLISIVHHRGIFYSIVIVGPFVRPTIAARPPDGGLPPE
jgi:hypothetical protein